MAHWTHRCSVRVDRHSVALTVRPYSAGRSILYVLGHRSISDHRMLTILAHNSRESAIGHGCCEPPRDVPIGCQVAVGGLINTRSDRSPPSVSLNTPSAGSRPPPRLSFSNSKWMRVPTDHLNSTRTRQSDGGQPSGCQTPSPSKSMHAESGSRSKIGSVTTSWLRSPGAAYWR